MSNVYEVLERYAKVAGTAGRVLRPSSVSIMVSADTLTAYSYGSHFPLSVLMPEGDVVRGWWLVNGDRYSHITSGHQSTLRSALLRTGLPMLTVPFTALDSAGIRRSTVRPVHVTDDTWTTVTRYGTAGDCPSWADSITDLGDGRRSWTVQEHHLGGAVLTATYRVWDGTADHVATASFLSAFDEQEGHGLYFLAQLPEGCHPQTVAEAFTMLRPAEVLKADMLGVHVTRQGDVFAVPASVTTRELPGPSAHAAYVLGVSHVATEVREHLGVTYGRGFLRHRPRESWRQPEHRMQRIGDGRAWHALIRNTVPDGRSWSLGGRVD